MIEFFTFLQSLPSLVAPAVNLFCGVCFSTTWRALAFIQQIRSTQPKDVYKILAYILKER